MKRLTDTPLPPYYFLPGKAQHPEKEGGYMRDHIIDVGEFDSKSFSKNHTYLYAIDLFNLGYYWESHVYWEALWHHAGRKGEVADHLKALIKIAAAGVKFKLSQTDVANDHLNRAQELLSPLPEPFYGLRAMSFLKTIKDEQIQTKGERVFKEFLFIEG